MRGVITNAAARGLRRTIALCLAVALALFLPSKPALANLELARDRVATIAPDVPNIVHEIYFVLPTSAQQITPTNYILIDFPNYQNITISNLEVLGVYGTVSKTLAGTRVTLTGFSMLPGTGATITGIMATNPGVGLSNQVVLRITEDAAGTIVRNSATIVPTDGTSFVNVTATIQSPLAALTVNGWTAPLAFVTMTEGTSVIGTTVADGTGFFNFNFTGISPGAHTYRIYSTDSSSRSTAQSSLNLFLIANSLTTASNLILSSTLSVVPSEIEPGDPIQFAGSAKPNSQINIFVEAPLRSYFSSTDANGNWSFTMDTTETSGLSPGEYQVYTIVQDGIGNQSVVSPTLNFTVLAPDDPNNPPPSCDISRGDLNCDSNVNLTDFSILLFHWNTNHRVADINADGTVNLVDFSIMMFNFNS